MNNWQRMTLGEFAPFVYGKALLKENRISGSNPVYGSNGIVDYADKAHVNNAGIIIGRKGTIGSVNLSTTPFWPIDTTFYIEDEPEKRDLLFTYYLLKTLHFQNTDSAVPGLNRDMAHSAIVNIPPLPEQKAIAGVLGALDDKIEANRKENETLEVMAAALFKSWFVDFEPFGETMPNDWREGKLSDITDVTTGKRPNDKQTNKDNKYSVPVYGGNGISWFTDEVLITEPVILTGRVGTLGSFYRVYEPVWVSDNAIIIKPNSNFFEYVYFSIQQIDITSFNRGSTQPLLTQTDVKNIEIIIPDDETIKKFSEVISTLFDKITQNKIQSETLAQIRDALLPRLMSGKIRIPPFGGDE